MKYLISYLRILFVFLASVFYFITAIPVIMVGDKAFHRWAQSWSRTLLFFMGIKPRIHGSLPQTGESFIFSANHTSYVDIPLMFHSIRTDLRIVYKQELEKVFFFGWVLKKCPYISINRSNPRKALQSINDAVEKIKNGASVLLFPEGTRQPNGQIGDFKRGAFMLADKSQKRIIPIKIVGGHTIIGKKGLINSQTIDIIIGEPLELPSPFNKISELALINEIREWTIATKAE